MVDGIKNFAGTSLHEVTHATSGEEDVSREFEGELTKFLRIISEKGVKNV